LQAAHRNATKCGVLGRHRYKVVALDARFHVVSRNVAVLGLVAANQRQAAVLSLPRRLAGSLPRLRRWENVGDDVLRSFAEAEAELLEVWIEFGFGFLLFFLLLLLVVVVVVVVVVCSCFSSRTLLSFVMRIWKKKFFCKFHFQPSLTSTDDAFGRSRLYTYENVALLPVVVRWAARANKRCHSSE
jgi:hypothetical protein